MYRMSKSYTYSAAPRILGYSLVQSPEENNRILFLWKNKEWAKILISMYFLYFAVGRLRNYPQNTTFQLDGASPHYSRWGHFLSGSFLKVDGKDWYDISATSLSRVDSLWHLPLVLSKCFVNHPLPSTIKELNEKITESRRYSTLIFWKTFLKNAEARVDFVVR